ncbi:MAG: GFA family protein, partial [Paraglaciecola chathamensis]
MKKITGSCLCDTVQFECNDSIESFHLCHCTQCQKVTGS